MVLDYTQLVGQQQAYTQSRLVSDVVAEQRAKEEAQREMVSTQAVSTTPKTETKTETVTTTRPTTELEQIDKQIRKLNKALDSASPKAEEIILERLRQLNESRDNLINQGLAYYTTKTEVPVNVEVGVTPRYSESLAGGSRSDTQGLFYEIPMTDKTTSTPVYTLQPSTQGGYGKLVSTGQTINPITFQETYAYQPTVQTQTVKQQEQQFLQQLPSTFTTQQVTTPRTYSPQETVTTQTQGISFAQVNPQEYGQQLVQQGIIKANEPYEYLKQKQEEQLYSPFTLEKVPAVVGTTVGLFGAGAIKGVVTAPQFFSPTTYQGELQVPILTPTYQFGKYLVTGQYIPDLITNPAGTTGEFVGATQVLKATPFKQIGEAELKYGIYEPVKSVGEASKLVELKGSGIPSISEFESIIKKGLELDKFKIDESRVIDITLTKPTASKSESTTSTIITSRNEPLLITKDLNFYDLNALAEAGKNIPSKTELGLTPSEAKLQRQEVARDYIQVPKYDELGNPIPYNSRFIQDSPNPQNYLIPREDYNKYLRRTKGALMTSQEQGIFAEKQSVIDKGLFKEREQLREEQLKEQLDVVRVERYDSLGNEIPYQTKNKFIVSERFVEIPREDYNKYLRRSTPRTSYESAISDLVSREKSRIKEYNQALELERAKLRLEMREGTRVNVPAKDSLGNKINYGTSNVKEVNEYTVSIPEREYNKYLRRSTPRTQPVTELQTNLISGLIEVKLSSTKKDVVFKQPEPVQKKETKKEKEVETGKEGQVQILEEPKQEEKGKTKRYKTVTPTIGSPSSQYVLPEMVQETQVVSYQQTPLSSGATSRFEGFNQQYSQSFVDSSRVNIGKFAPQLETVQQRISLLGVTQPITKPETIQQLKQEPQSQSQFKFDLRQSTEQKQEVKNVLELKTDITSRTDVRTFTDVLSRLDQTQKLETSQVTELKTPQITQNIEEEKIINKSPKIFVEREKSKKRSKFVAVTKRRGKVVAIGGTESESKFEALGKGTRNVRETLARSLGVLNVETGQLESPTFLPSGFRSSKRTSSFVVQSNALSSQGEKMEIQSAKKRKGVFK